MDAFETVAAAAFEQPRLRYRTAEVFATNRPSQRPIEAVGFRRASVFEAADFFDGESSVVGRSGLLATHRRADR